MKTAFDKSIYILLGLLLLMGCTDWQDRANNENQETTLPITTPTDTTEIDLQDKTVHDGEEDKISEEWPKPSTFNEEHKKKLQNALDIAVNVTEDSLFNQIIMELADNNEIDWGCSRLSRIPSRHRNAPTAFILSEFESRGMNNISDFQAYEWKPGSNQQVLF